MEVVSWLITAVPLALAPGTGIVFFIYFRDKFEKEPFRVLRNCFLFGLLSVIPPALIETLASMGGIDENRGTLGILIYAFAVVSLSEEFSKFAFLRWYAYRKPSFNEPFDGIVYSVMIAMGFATLENLIYVIYGGIDVALLRMFTAVPMHASAAIIMGFFLGRAKFSSHRRWNTLLALLIPVIIHGMYDYFLFRQDIPWLAFFSGAVLVISVILALWAIGIHRKASPFNPNNQPREKLPE